MPPIVLKFEHTYSCSKASDDKPFELQANCTPWISSYDDILVLATCDSGLEM